jgi:8-oxo-dGTP diphosphatase
MDQTESGEIKTTRIIDVAAALVFFRRQLLITQRPPGGHLAGFWEFPGGKVEPNESWEDCLHRELLEELSYDVRVGDLFSEIVHHYPEKSVRLRFFHCTPSRPDSQPVAMGCSAFAWITQAELGHYAFPPADAKLLEALQTDLSIWKTLPRRVPTSPSS